MIDFIDRVLAPWLWLFADWSLRWAMLIVVLVVWLLVVRPRRSATRYAAARGQGLGSTEGRPGCVKKDQPVSVAAR